MDNEKIFPIRGVKLAELDSGKFLKLKAVSGVVLLLDPAKAAEAGCEVYAENSAALALAKSIIVSPGTDSGLGHARRLAEQSAMPVEVRASAHYISDPKFSWAEILSPNAWSSLRGASAIRDHGVPSSVEERARLIRLLRRYEPEKDIPVVYEDLVQYSRCFYLAYGPHVLLDIERRGGIRGFDLLTEVKCAVSDKKIRADEGEALLYAFPGKQRDFDEALCAASFAEVEND